jgi:hypothetical protein
LHQSEKHITSFIILRNKSIWKNGTLLFENEVPDNDFLKTAYETLDNNYPKFYKMDALGKQGIIAANLLLKDFEFEKYKHEEVGIVLSNCNSSIEADVNYYESAKTFPSPSLFVYTLPNIVIGEISIRYKFKGENAFYISEKFDAEWLYFYVNNLLQENKIKACVCGWIDAVSDHYDACLFLIEQEAKENAITFTANNVKRIFEERRSGAEAQ